MPSAEVWVGNWRPHRPRGPIAALYGSPGPKYGLPGLTGSSQHDPTKLKAPMFSFGARHSSRCESSPGPSYLIPSNVTRVGRDGTPAFFSPEPSKGAGCLPGPWTRALREGGLFRSAPAFSLSGRCKEFNIIQTPGPASYTLPPVLGSKTVATCTAPTYSFSGRSKTGGFSEDLKKTPGPAAYKVVDPCIYSKKPPQFSMTGRNFPTGETTQKPGPGAHYPEQVTFTKAKAPSFSFGLRHSDYILPLIENVPE
ncbi:outer dense fiber protein 3-B-like [Plectropomus leopardus]|uniref:outer dense fiber protein 3-B-like n=1 Tax=Plectropomus leopardus TaxID=160734 RepID=UPI001C4C305F|nr:outer dense fiber protein 3-B-like [Plectropomus leopardus]